MIPPLDARGLLPAGEHPASLAELRGWFADHAHPAARLRLLEQVTGRLLPELRAAGLVYPCVIGGSCLSDKPAPGDIEVTLDVRNADPAAQFVAFVHWQRRAEAMRAQWSIDYYPTIAVANNFCAFFAYVGDKTAADKGLSPRDLRGVVRIESW